MNPSNRARSARPSTIATTSKTSAPQQGAPSRPRPSIATAASAPIPQYEPLQHPLNPAAQQALAKLQATHKIDNVQRRLKLANEVLSECAGDLNERFVERERRVRAKAGARGDGGKENERGDGEEDEEIDVERIRGTQEREERERGIREMREKVRGMTARMEEHVRKVVDAQKGVVDIGEVLVEVRTIAAADVHAASQLGSATQQRQRRRGMGGNDEEMDGDGNEGLEDGTMGSIEPTLDGNSHPTQQPPRAPSQIFKERLQQRKDEYQSLSLSSRYSKHNDYIGFKRTVHDAIHGDDGPPLPPSSKWFDEERGSPAPGTQIPTNSTDAEESDDDIAILREKLSTKCPLTFTEFKDPVTSTKCPHTFERIAITSLIQQSTSNVHGNPIRARTWNNETRAVQCPVAGCSATLTGEDLRVDQVLVRKIRRLQEAKRRLEREEDDSDVVPDTPTSKERAAPPVDSNGGDVEMEGRPAMKGEVRSTTAATRTAQSMVIDLSD